MPTAYVTTTELRSRAGAIWRRVAAGDEIVVTRRGKPFAIIAPAATADVQEKVRALRAAGLRAALNAVQRHAAATGLDKMTQQDIDSEIAAARAGRARGSGKR